ncbi:MAG: hypothetical protein JNG84_09470 [Archangium sp.]|nr:hypothetical protein [Archangium sp.]
MTDLHSLWKTPGAPLSPLSPEELSTRSRRVERIIWWRNAREYAAAVVVLASFGAWALLASSWLTQLGCVLVMAGTAFIVRTLWAHGSSETADVTAPSADFYRHTLERQRALLASAWAWYLGPLVPGMALLFTDLLIRAQPGHRGTLGLAVAVCAAMFVAIGWLNASAARKIEAELHRMGDDGRGAVGYNQRP